MNLIAILILDRATSKMEANLVNVDPFAPPSETAAGREYFGFVMYLSSYVFAGTVSSYGFRKPFLIYAIWMLVPEKYLHALGITYYPDRVGYYRHFGAVIPIWIWGLIPFILITLNASILIRTPKLDSFGSLVDEHSKPMKPSFVQVMKDRKQETDLHDLPITIINRAMFNETNKTLSSESATYK
ncbi:hypothetical protein HK096_011634 [Nowakowskiella sp. JEL0078]|nr:hypothetical protein HK096_011634 [Nowakowskiella sp. JEL0078]